MSTPTRPVRRSDLGDLAGYHSPQHDVAVRLNTNESPYPPPSEFVREWTSALAEVPAHRYPDRGARDLRRALAARFNRAPEELFCANGSNEVLQTLLLTYGGAGRSALVCEPTYALHRHISRITGTDVHTVARNSDFTVDVDGMVDAISNLSPAIAFLCSPNNPTGTVDSPAAIATILDACDASGSLLIVDEAYAEFAPESATALVAEDRNLVVTRTYSKVWSLAAVRLGFAVAPSWLVDDLDAVALPYRLSVATQLAGLYALRFVEEMESRIGRIVEERDRLSRALLELGVEVFPSGANFVLLRMPQAGSAWNRLVERGVLVRDFSSWPGLTNCLRVTVGTEQENDAFLRALAAVQSELGTGR